MTLNWILAPRVAYEAAQIPVDTFARRFNMDRQARPGEKDAEGNPIEPGSTVIEENVLMHLDIQLHSEQLETLMTKPGVMILSDEKLQWILSIYDPQPEK